MVGCELPNYMCLQEHVMLSTKIRFIKWVYIPENPCRPDSQWGLSQGNPVTTVSEITWRVVSSV